ncbi:hypothetical protein MVEN_01810500 [Mycena venus]|uniref:Uncharacterized protein n=1 Tax=Mycena venus TaxID=2733690 RepID=A0A8H6XIN1_9AGAR|nr:hypothetical protein MVEN_01810500 [Mycena venus]
MPALPASLLPFLPPGLSPSSSFVVLPMLPWFFALLALFGFVVRHTLASLSFASLRALPEAAGRLLRALRRPTHAYSATSGSESLLPITSPNAGRSTAPAPQETLRGRGRARSKAGPGRSRFGIGLGLGLGRRAKSLGPVLPRFSPPAQASHHVRGASTHGTSAPASPGLQVPGFMRGDDDAVPLVDLTGSWASISSLSSRSTEASGSGSGRPSMSTPDAPPAPLPAHPDIQLVDVSHPSDEFELIDVSVPPSPAAWALAHPAPAHPHLPLHPTPTAPTSPAASSSAFPMTAFSLAKPPAPSHAKPTTPPTPKAAPAPIPMSSLISANATISSLDADAGPNMKSMNILPPAPPQELEVEQEAEVELPIEQPACDTPPWQQTQLPSPPLSPPHGRAMFQVPAIPVPLPIESVWMGRNDDDVHEPSAERRPRLTARPEKSTVAMWEEEEQDEERQQDEAEQTVSPSLPAAEVEERAPVEVQAEEEAQEQELELELPSAHAIDVLVQRMHDQPPAPALAYTDLLSPAPAHEPLESESPITDAAEVGDEAEELPSACAIDVLVGGMHAYAAAAPAPVPVYVHTPVQEADVPPYISVPAERTQRKNGRKKRQRQMGKGSEHAWDGEVVPLDEVLERAEGEPWEEDPEEMPLPALPLPSRDGSRAVSPLPQFGGQEYEADAEEGEEQEDPEELPLPPMPLPLHLSMRDGWDADHDLSMRDVWAWDAPPPADDGDVEPLVLDEVAAEGESEEGVEASEGRTEDEEDDGYEAEDGDADAVEVEAESDSVDEEEQIRDVESVPALHIDTAHLASFSPPHRPMSVAGALHVETAHLAPEDAPGDVREQDLASTLSSLSSTSPSSAAVTEGVRVVLPSASATLLPSAASTHPSATTSAEDADNETATLLPEKEEADEESESSSDDEVDLADMKPAWSRRAAAAPALGLPSSTREREHAVPGAFPSSTSATFAASGTLTPTPASASPPSGEKTKTSTDTGTSTAVDKKPAGMRARYRSPLDAALAMQLRPGLGVGADGAWLVRFLMSFFGWFAVLVARTSD